MSKMRWFSFAMGCLFWVGMGSAYASESPFVHKSFDGFSLAGKIAYPKGVTDANAGRVVILIHGSGPQGMDSDLTAASAGKKNLFFCDIRDGLVPKGFVVLRYNKRSYEIGLKAKKDRAYVKGKEFKTFMENPLKFFVEDVRSLVRWTHKKMPKAKIYLAGFSQGTYVALQAADQEKDVAGVVLSGFYTSTLETVSFGQLVYRPLHWFRRYDKNKDGKLEPSELTNAGRAGLGLIMQSQVLDADGDGKISMAELQGGNLVNMLRFQKMLKANTMQELRYPSVDDILKRAKFRVLFFQGMWDNQTPAYHALSIRVLAKFVWKKESIRFFFFPKLGHILDKRERYDDVVYRRMDQGALSKVSQEMALFLR